jgi:hypothetical protein
MQEKTAEASAMTLLDSNLETFRVPEGVEIPYSEGAAKQVSVTSIVNVVSHLFSFRENSNTPGRRLEQSVVVTIPSGAGFFLCLSTLNGAFTSSNFQNLNERPLGQFMATLGMRGDNLVCTVRLSDNDANDPIAIDVRALVVFYR